MNLDEFLKKTSPSWKGVTETSELDVSVLISHVLGRSRTWVLSHREHELSTTQIQELEQKLELYRRGVPLPYLIGKWEFFGHEFFVTEATLIPRPETELMVEEVLSWLEKHPSATHVLDIGTGSGCIAISLALSCERICVVASDISLAALRVAQRNVAKFQLQKRVLLVSASLLPPLAKKFDVICANLPYIPSERLKRLPIYGKEPTLALDGGSDGLDLYRALFDALQPSVPKGCLIACEIDSAQVSEMKTLARKAFPEAKIAVIKDLSNRERLLKVEV